jgi:hypothetical protein
MKNPSILVLKLAVLITATTCFLQCSSEKTQHDYLIGHWKQIGDRSSTDNPNLVAASQDTEKSEIYFSKKIMWYVGEDNIPKSSSYEIIEENANDSLLKIQTTYNNEVTNIDIKFSSGYNVIQVIQRHQPTIPEGLPDDMKNIIRQQVGMITTIDIYTRVDNRKSPHL